MVVEFGSWPTPRPACGGSDVLQGVGPEVFPHVLGGNVPYGEQDALPFVVARAVLMRLTEVPQSDWSVHRGDDLGQVNLGCRSCENVASSDTALGSHQTGALQCEKNLFEVGLGQSGSFGNVTNRRGTLTLCVQREREKCPAGIVSSSRNAHRAIVGGELEP